MAFHKQRTEGQQIRWRYLLEDLTERRVVYVEVLKGRSEYCYHLRPLIVESKCSVCTHAWWSVMSVQAIAAANWTTCNTSVALSSIDCLPYRVFTEASLDTQHGHAAELCGTHCLLSPLHHQQRLFKKLLACHAGSGCGECNEGQPQQGGGRSVPVRPNGGQGEPVAGAVRPQGSVPSPHHGLLTSR